MVIVKIAGCNGSGKTTLMRALLSDGFKPVMGPKGRPVAYTHRVDPGTKLVILGSYENVCGGMDTISDKEDRMALVKKYARPENIVFFEGLITGKTYGAFGELSETPKHRGRWIYAFMDTPYEVCIERVLKRRWAAAEAKGREPTDFDPERTMRPTFKSCNSTRLRAQEQGHEIFMINHKKNPASEATRLLRRAMELHNG